MNALGSWTRRNAIGLVTAAVVALAHQGVELRCVGPLRLRTQHISCVNIFKQAATIGLDKPIDGKFHVRWFEMVPLDRLFNDMVNASPEKRDSLQATIDSGRKIADKGIICVPMLWLVGGHMTVGCYSLPMLADDAGGYEVGSRSTIEMMRQMAEGVRRKGMTAKDFLDDALDKPIKGWTPGHPL